MINPFGVFKRKRKGKPRGAYLPKELKKMTKISFRCTQQFKNSLKGKDPKYKTPGLFARMVLEEYLAREKEMQARVRIIPKENK